MSLDRITSALPVIGAAVGALTAVLMSGSVASGILIGCLVGTSPMIAVMVLALIAMHYEVPACHCGRATSISEGRNSYRFVCEGSSSDALKDKWWQYECPHCHRRYIQRNGLFRFLSPDGIEEPYMRSARLGWKRDRAAHDKRS